MNQCLHVTHSTVASAAAAVPARERTVKDMTDRSLQIPFGTAIAGIFYW